MQVESTMNAHPPHSAIPQALSEWSAERLPAQEPSFIDLLVTLAQHKVVVIGCTALGLAAGVTIAVLVPRSYAYLTTLELGTLQQGSASAIESPEAVIAKVTNVFLPVIERSHGETIGEPGFTLGMDIKNPRGTNLVVLTSKGPVDHEQEHVTLHQRVAERVLNGHKQQFQMLRTNLELELEQARRAAAALKDQAATLVLRRALLEEDSTRNTRRLAKIEGEMARIAGNRDVASKNLTGQEQVLTVMMLDLELARERGKQDELDRQLTLGMKESRDRLIRDEADLQRTEQDHLGKITAIQARMAIVAVTKLVDEPQRSQKPVGMGRSLIAILGVVVGMLAGIGIALTRQALLNRARALNHHRNTPA